MTVHIYSALYGGYDTVKPLPEGVSGLLFTDRSDLDATGTGWTVRYVPHGIVTPNGDPRIVAPMLAHKYWKCHPLAACPESDVSIWVDASISLEPGFVDQAIQALGDDDWSCVPHPWRNCVYDEAAFSATLPRYASMRKQILDQAAFYGSIGHPAHWGLTATGLIVRRHTKAVEVACDSWWWENVTRSHQDQVSLPVIRRLHDDVRYNDKIGWERGWRLWPHLK